MSSAAVAEPTGMLAPNISGTPITSPPTPTFSASRRLIRCTFILSPFNCRPSARRLSPRIVVSLLPVFRPAIASICKPLDREMTSALGSGPTNFRGCRLRAASELRLESYSEDVLVIGFIRTIPAICDKMHELIADIRVHISVHQVAHVQTRNVVVVIALDVFIIVVGYGYPCGEDQVAQQFMVGGQRSRRSENA